MLSIYERVRSGNMDIRLVALAVGSEGVRRILAREKRRTESAPAVGGDYPSVPEIQFSGKKLTNSDMWDSGKRLPQSAMLVSEVTIGSKRIVPPKAVAQSCKMQIYRAQGVFAGAYEKAASMHMAQTGINQTFCKLIPLELPAQYYRRIIVSDYPSQPGSNSRSNAALTMFDLPAVLQTANETFAHKPAQYSTYFPMKKTAKFECTNLNVNFPIKAKVTFVQLKNASTQGSGLNVIQSPSNAVNNVLADMPVQHRGSDATAFAKSGIVGSSHKIYADGGQVGTFEGSYDWTMRSRYDFKRQPNYKDHFREVWSANYTIAPGGTRKIDFDNYFSLCPQHAGDYAQVNIDNAYTRDQIFALVQVEGVATPYYKVEKASTAAGPVTRRLWGRAQTCPSSFTTRMTMDLEMYVQKSLLANTDQAGGLYYRRNYLKLSGESNTSEQNYCDRNKIFHSDESFEASTGQTFGFIVPVESQKVMRGVDVRFNKVSDED